jgi:Response regulators consisting of a CheY-like receiver domain and a winged-helix DNA-binding domain
VIWLVEDARDLSEEISSALSAAGFAVRVFTTGAEVLEEFGRERPELILLDAFLPDVDVDTFCARLAHAGKMKATPLMVITANAESAGDLLSRHITIADCIVKPFTADALIARVFNVLRRLRSRGVSGRFLAARPKGGPALACSPDSRQAVVDGESIQLSPVEHRLLVVLVGQKGVTLSRADLLKSIWTEDADISPRSVDVAMVALRRKLGRVGNSIKSVRGVGYRFVE